MGEVCVFRGVNEIRSQGFASGYLLVDQDKKKKNFHMIYCDADSGRTEKSLASSVPNNPTVW